MSEPRYPFVVVDVAPTEREEVIDLLWDAGATGIEERDETTLERSRSGRVAVIAHFETDGEATDAVTSVSPRWEARIDHIVGDDWKFAWRKYFKPTRVGARFVVRPPWEPFTASPGDLVLTIEPGQAFGTGTHETTKLVLRLIEDVVRSDARVLDLGCGSGILAVGAVKLGAAHVIAIDIDPEAARATTENATLNGVSQRVEARVGTVDDIAGQYDVVLANIEARVLVPSAREITTRAKIGGAIALSGILADQEEMVSAAYRDAGGELLRVERDGEWIALLVTRSR